MMSARYRANAFNPSVRLFSSPPLVLSGRLFLPPPLPSLSTLFLCRLLAPFRSVSAALCGGEGVLRVGVAYSCAKGRMADE